MMTRKIGLLLLTVLLLATATASTASGSLLITYDFTCALTVARRRAWTRASSAANPTTPVEPLLVARNLDAGRRVEVLATPTDEVGHFTAEVTFPVEGQWTWTILPNPLAGDAAFEPLTVLPAAPQTTTNAAAPQLTTAPALSPADGLRWAAVAVAGLAVVAALLQARKHPEVKAHADL